MQKIILRLLAFLARTIVRFHKPTIIGITGTVGKTTVTSHVSGYLSHILGEDMVGHSRYHYNGEYGLPLTIIGARTGGKNPIRWIWVCVVALSRFFRSYPRYLVLEYGIDHPGEMDFLVSIAIPDIAILTEVAPNHLEQFGTFESYRNEKLKLTRDARDVVIHESLRNYIDREVYIYGEGGMSAIDVSDVRLTPDGTEGIVHMHRSEYPLSIHAFGVFHLVNVLPLYAVAEILSLDIKLIAPYIATTQGEAGRSTLLWGKYGSRIIDGSYNGGYLSLHAGILSLESFLPDNQLICLIGDMRELGVETERLHTKLAEEITEKYKPLREHIRFYLVGPYMHEYVNPVLGMNFHTEHYYSSREAGNSILQYLSHTKTSNKTIIFVKGSQNTIFLEEAVEKLLENPQDISRLCRQSPEWKRKKDAFFVSLKGKK